LDGLAYREGMITFMTTNYLCNLDSALIRPGRIDKSLNFGLATEDQTRHMFLNFYEDKGEEFDTFYKKIKRCNFTTALLQDLFMICMDDYDKLYSDDVISNFKENCSKHNYDKKLDLYS
jgi:SpoVK/Ycf46/Vps4 family AAA+-type ATPase